MAMECTQRLECTQDLDATQVERVSEEQVGFLGICGKTYPIMRGPNKIGRDPQTCSIVLNLNSISRQHAVINILNKKDFMLMDLGSANKTKLLNKNLHSYIPHPLKNGDTVQFGDVFGIFRLLEENYDLPMTQAIDIPETPISNKYTSRLNQAPITTIPESPDVSDKDDSFIIPSQSTDRKLKSAGNHNFIKPAVKTISIQPVGINKIDNIYWKSSKKSTSFSMTLNDSSTSLNESPVSAKPDELNASKDKDIYEMETQPPTHLRNESTDSIYTADTQIPVGILNSNSIHILDTQLPVPTTEHLPQVQKVHDKLDMQLDIFAANKENDNSICNAKTQMVPERNASLTMKNVSISSKNTKSPNNRSNASDDDLLLFEDVDGPVMEENFESQAILPQDLPPIFTNESGIDQLAAVEKSKVEPKKRVIRLKSDSSTDCEDIDILPTQQIPLKKVDAEDDVTDCEDDFIELKVDKSALKNIALEDMETQMIDAEATKGVNIEDLPTQLLIVKDPPVIDPVKAVNNNEPDIEDMCTQVIPYNSEVIETQSQYSPDVISQFKAPLKSSRKLIRKDTPKLVKPIETKPNEINENYYANTQDLCEDLSSQQQFSPDIAGRMNVKTVNLLNKKSPIAAITSGKLKNSCGDKKIPRLENQLSPKKSYLDKTPGSSDSEEKVNKFVSNLSSPQVRDIIGVAPMRKIPSEGSDVDVTPKKVRPFKFMTIDLPNSQEIKTSVSVPTKSPITDSSSDSEIENNSSEQFTPILFKKKKKTKVDAKIDLSKQFEIEALPTKIITRRRKPTEKVKQAEENKGRIKNILMRKFLTVQDDNIDSDIVTENIMRLKSKYVKSKEDIELKNDAHKEITDKIERKKHTRKNEVHTKIETKQDISNIKSPSNKESGKQKESRHRTVTKEPLQLNENEICTTKAIDKPKESRRGRPKKDKNIKNCTDLTKADTDIDLTKTEIDLTKTKRSTRPRHKKNEKKTASPEKEILNTKTSEKSEQREPSVEKETDIRRSKRQRVAKEKKEIIKVKIKSILRKNTHEQSTVYNISSVSSCDSPRSLKRSAMDTEGPSAKRTRPVNPSSSSLRQTPARQVRTQYILFTAFPYEEVKVKLEKLGAVVVTDVKACTVVLTLKIKRTFKLLCAVGLGRPIVGPNWVQACADADMIVDPWPYIMKDETVERRFQFNLERTLTGKRNFLKGYNVYSTPSVLPNALEMKLIVECSGGVWKDEGRSWICVSSAADKHLWPSLRRRGATIVSTEFILGGVLKQKLDIAGNMF